MRRISPRTSLQHPQRHQRRSGQVLLLLVLLMIIAALLGSTFLLIVSLDSHGFKQETKRVAGHSGNTPNQRNG